MKSIKQFSSTQEKLSIPELHKILCGKNRVTFSKTFVYNGNRYTVESVDKKNKVTSRTTVTELN